MRLAVIPARGGSKRIPRKNIKEFCGKPIIAWSIQATRESGCFDRIIVSTDDEEIAAVAREWGAEVPFMRPKELSDDYVGTIPVIRHAIEWFAEKSISFNHVCCIYATAPFVTSDDIRHGLEALKESGSDYAFSVTSYPFPIQRAIKITSDGWIEMFQPEHFSTRSQDLEEAYHDAGQFYWGRSEAWIQELPLFSGYTIPIILPRYRVQDIDTPEDWISAEMMFRLLKQD
ncbi:pseudaminic acid cytidylyltransferase [Methanocalculus sp.]|uniref:pseudaminic acid cytidylyltransferase n=1 Tax=Methanocalculus sp. TaxID=2004547 RepID=UPI0026118300|nr:pseudaminic acid cytidylyltransferase [Methanocalculus sp.]MDG6250730.1 pseudaminic acid cytidylyltransferase [Methanocalculus sp.]